MKSCFVVFLTLGLSLGFPLRPRRYPVSVYDYYDFVEVPRNHQPSYRPVVTMTPSGSQLRPSFRPPQYPISPSGGPEPFIRGRPDYHLSQSETVYREKPRPEGPHSYRKSGYQEKKHSYMEQNTPNGGDEGFYKGDRVEYPAPESFLKEVAQQENFYEETDVPRVPPEDPPVYRRPPSSSPTFEEPASYQEPVANPEEGPYQREELPAEQEISYSEAGYPELIEGLPKEKRQAHSEHTGYLDKNGVEFADEAARVEKGDGSGRLTFQIHGQQGPHSYRFGYDTGKGYNRQFRYEEKDGNGEVRGRYGFYDKDGKLQVVNYSAHPKHGFSADVPH